VQAFAIALFIWHYALPVTVFAYCYGRILHIVRRQSQIMREHQGTSMETTSRENAGQIQQQETATCVNLSRTEMNVLQTMIAVIICFLICWTLLDISNVLQRMGVSKVMQ